MTGSQTSFGISVTDKRQHKDTKGLRRRSRLDERTTSQLKQLKRRHSVSKGFIESYQQTERKKRTNNRQGFHLSAAEVQDSLKKPSEQNWELQLASIATSVLQMLMLSECTDTGGKKKIDRDRKWGSQSSGESEKDESTSRETDKTKMEVFAFKLFQSACWVVVRTLAVFRVVPRGSNGQRALS